MAGKLRIKKYLSLVEKDLQSPQLPGQQESSKTWGWAKVTRHILWLLPESLEIFDNKNLFWGLDNFCLHWVYKLMP